MTEWMRRAACRVNPSLMWDEPLEAKQLCSVCPVLPDCAEWENTLDGWVPGVVAGMDEQERARARKRCCDCGAYMPKSKGQSYCRACKSIRQSRYYAERDEVRVKTCPQCGDRFTVQHGNRRFCVDAHRIAFYENRKRLAKSTRLATTG